MAKILVTGAAGFIGYHLCRRLLQRGEEVVGCDNLNAYYDVQLKHDRLAQLRRHDHFQFQRVDLAADRDLEQLFLDHRPHAVLHMAAQAGVRYSLENPRAYAQSNLIGFLNVLEGCRRVDVAHLVYASSSSVYGANTKLPFSTTDPVDHPVSLYAASKKANELMAHSYSALYGLPTTGLRFFTVYGPWGRPDMAIYSFTDAILEGRPIDLYNYGRMRRDFTYIDDVIEGVVRVLARPPQHLQDGAASPTTATSGAPYRLYNIGNHQAVDLLAVVQLLEKHLGRTAQKRYLPMQPGDVLETFADVHDLQRDVGFRPATPIEIGIQRFVAWYRAYHASRTARMATAA
jgi:UDP-glucuronate 4-epimerase